MEDRVAESFEHALQLLYADAWDDGIERYRSKYVFRGLSDIDYPLLTSLQRLGGTYTGLERHLLRNFRKYSGRNEATLEYSDWQWLTLAQHHGLPTRLLDWTYSPTVALHFATRNIERYQADGVVWCVNLAAAHELVPVDLRAELLAQGAHAFTVGMIEQAARTLDNFDQRGRLDEFVMFLEPPSLDARIVNQYALHSVMPGPHCNFGEWLTHNPEMWYRVILPHGIKWEIRDKLDGANVNERVLFPGLDGLADWLKRHYSPKVVPSNRPNSTPLPPRHRLD